MSKKLVCAVLVVLVLCAVAFGAQKKPKELRVGDLSFLGTTEETMQSAMDEVRSVITLSPVRSVMGYDNEAASQLKETLELVEHFRENRHVMKFFDSLTSMLMALDAGRIDGVILPIQTARYVMRNDPEYKILLTLNAPISIAFGFRENSASLRDEFNKAIEAMKADGTLAAFEEKYTKGGDAVTEAADFTIFEGAETIKVAVTGDLPPIDYVDEKGKAAGYNTAVIAEIGRRLKKNVALLSIESGARSSALTSGRADVVFWYRTMEGKKFLDETKSLAEITNDKADGIIISEPYHGWDRILILTK